MKHTFRIILVAAMVVLTVAFVGCQKEKSNDDGAEASSGGNNSRPEAPAGWVDLGLPSGLLWAECNVGANAPEDAGSYYAWGETSTKSDYSWSTYAFGSDDYLLTKYCSNAEYGLDGYIDSLIILEPNDDAAAIIIADGARIPTKKDWQELINNVNAELTIQDSVYGCKFTSTNGNSLFLPAVGYRDGSEHYDADNYGYYWSASLYTDIPNHAWNFGFDSSYKGLSNSYRFQGFSIRAVRAR